MAAFTETILTDVRVCTGCLACELACGFRWTKKMDPARSSIRVRRDESSGRMGIEVLPSCDACRGTETPSCVAVCAPRALSLGRRVRRTEEAAT